MPRRLALSGAALLLAAACASSARTAGSSVTGSDVTGSDVTGSDVTGSNVTGSDVTAAAPAASPSPTSPPCLEPLLFCDGFEDDPPGQAPGAPWHETGSSGARVQVEETRAFRGRRAVHVSAPRGAAYRRGYFALHQSPVFPAAAAQLYGRAMVWLDAAPRAAGESVHWTMVQGEGRSRDGTFNSLYRYGGQHQQGLGLMANYETTPPVRSDCWQHSQRRLPVRRWACVEWRFAVAGNELQLWLDGEEVSDVHVVDRGQGPESGCLATEALGGQWLAPPKFQSLYLGWERYQDTLNDQDLWLDEIAVSVSRIGCPASADTAAGTGGNTAGDTAGDTAGN